MYAAQEIPQIDAEIEQKGLSGWKLVYFYDLCPLRYSKVESRVRAGYKL
jgi:hypothetical protein